MNITQFIAGIFRMPANTDRIRQVGAEDGRSAATAYVDGFLEAASDVFADRLSSFKNLEPSEPPESEPEKPKRLLVRKASKGSQ